ncbi:hypothetical protein KJ910_00975 [Patescibacteria group bacterium]|nr:hypothetical protein [Patescibacteria group bacterium]MBU1907244.1 hypothetical protein [Patescibacteria group bacterium]
MKIMSKCNVCILSLAQATAVFIYIILISLFLNNAEQWFGQLDGVTAPVLMLMIFVFSAAVTGGLVLGVPILMYLEGAKAKAVKNFVATLGWMLLLIILTIVGYSIF